MCFSGCSKREQTSKRQVAVSSPVFLCCGGQSIYLAYLIIIDRAQLIPPRKLKYCIVEGSPAGTESRLPGITGRRFSPLFGPKNDVI
jgi:hypothetical protein